MRMKRKKKSIRRKWNLHPHLSTLDWYLPLNISGLYPHRRFSPLRVSHSPTQSQEFTCNTSDVMTANLVHDLRKISRHTRKILISAHRQKYMQKRMIRIAMWRGFLDKFIGELMQSSKLRSPCKQDSGRGIAMDRWQQCRRYNDVISRAQQMWRPMEQVL